MNTYLSIAQIVISIALILSIMLQVKGGGMGGIFGQADSVYRTRRGIERSLFQLTIILAVIFIIISIVALRVN
ncbi:MAG: preprotein translocase subunit SecG [Dehalococcoidales bacterium]|nr:MAG: preprotein translocase subunit SecG [Dehalococcoidales bacterium]